MGFKGIHGLADFEPRFAADGVHFRFCHTSTEILTFSMYRFQKCNISTGISMFLVPLMVCIFVVLGVHPGCCGRKLGAIKIKGKSTLIMNDKGIMMNRDIDYLLRIHSKGKL